MREPDNRNYCSRRCSRTTIYLTTSRWRAWQMAFASKSKMRISWQKCLDAAPNKR